MPHIAHLPHRGVLALTGADRVSFLNGLVSNDVSRAVPGNAVWAAMLTPQGRYLADFFILADETTLYLDTPLTLIETLQPKLRRFRLRAAVEVADLSTTHKIIVTWQGAPPQIAITAPDPRLAEAGFRAISNAEIATTASAQDYNAHRVGLGLPDGPPDLEPGTTLLLEANFDELHGVDWQKGCYMGQELTARTKYRGLIKRRLVPVTLSEPGPPPGTAILAEGAEAGTMRSSAGTLGLATIRLDALKKPLLAGNALLTPRIPPWMQLPE